MHKLISAVVGLILLNPLLTGCGGDDGTADASSPPSPDTSATGSDQPSTSSSDDTGDVEPADGPLVKLKDYTLRLPKGFELADQILSGAAQADRPDRPIGIDMVTVSDFPASEHSFDEMIKSRLRTSTMGLEHVKRLPDVEVDGERAFHISADITDGIADHSVYEAVGLTLPKGPGDRTGVGASIVWTMPASRSPEKRLELLQSVLATWQWR